jgi:putative nucleotidyltransferase with HDIG domain
MKGLKKVTVDREGIRKRLKSLKNLPTMPGVFQEINKSIQNPETTAEDIAKIISSDQALSAKILRIVNSVLYGFPRRISNIRHALIILGFDVVKGLLLSSSVFDIMLARGFLGLWQHSIGCAISAGVIAKKLNMPDPEEVFVAALLHDLGKVIIKLELPEESSLIEQKVMDNHISIYEAEKDILGFTHATVGKWLCQEWYLPNKLAYPITYHHQPNLSEFAIQSTAVVHVADSLVRGIGFGFAGDNFVPKIDNRSWDILGISDPLLEEIIREIDEKLDNAENMYPENGPDI